MSFSYIDIHTHLNFAAFDADRDATVKRALEAGVALINVGTQQQTSQKAVKIAEGYAEGVYAIVGLHPIHTSKSFHDEKELGEIPPAADLPAPQTSRQAGDSARPTEPSFGRAPFTKGRIKDGGFISRGEEFDYEYYKKLAAHPKVVGIGECGLDYYRVQSSKLKVESYRKRQEEAFRKQIELAIEVKKPLMLHLRNGSDRSAYNDAFSILKSYNLHLKSSRPGNLHFFAGSIEEAKPFLDMEYTFSFTGVVTFAKEYEEIVKYLPLDHILSETDSPYVAPALYRGKRNEPLYVREVVKAIARIRGAQEEHVRAQIVKNAEQLFGIRLA